MKQKTTPLMRHEKKDEAMFKKVAKSMKGLKKAPSKSKKPKQMDLGY